MEVFKSTGPHKPGKERKAGSTRNGHRIIRIIGIFYTGPEGAVFWMMEAKGNGYGTTAVRALAQMAFCVQPPKALRAFVVEIRVSTSSETYISRGTIFGAHIRVAVGVPLCARCLFRLRLTPPYTAAARGAPRHDQRSFSGLYDIYVV